MQQAQKPLVTFQFHKANAALMKCASNYEVINNYVGWLSIFMNMRAFQKFIISQLTRFLSLHHFDGRNNTDVIVVSKRLLNPLH